MWLPEMCPRAYMVATTTVAKANEIIPRSAIVNGASPLTMIVAGTDPTPTNTRNAVPTTSAASFWMIDGSSMVLSLESGDRCLVDYLGSHSTLSNVIWTIRLCFEGHKGECGHFRREADGMIQAVDRALRILTVLQGGRRMSLGEIAAAIDLAPSTV